VSDNANDLFGYDLGLTDKEVYHIGSIVAYWAALETEIFNQTLLTFDAPDDEEITLPKALHNLQFTKVLDLWKERVVDQAEGESADLLKAVYESINQLKEFRDALVHGMWEWSKKDISVISSRRVRKKEIVTINFNASDLEDFDIRLRKLNFKTRYPGGVLNAIQGHEGPIGHISRRFLAEITNNEIAGHYVTGRLNSNAEDRDAHDT